MWIDDDKRAGEALAEVIADKTVTIVSGAGVSTDAGIPDYRGKGSTEVPSVDFDMFISDPAWQRWTWYNNHRTWKIIDRLVPTAAHRVIARWQKAGLVNAVATQNIDGLHTKAGSDPTYKLHGTYALVECVQCGKKIPRAELDATLRALNPHVEQIDDPSAVCILPPADYQAARACDFTIAACQACGGILKPDVVFFGEMLPTFELNSAIEAARAADVIIAVGTSLAVSTAAMVFGADGFESAEHIIINRGPTYADAAADLRIEGGASEVLTAADRILFPPNS